MKILMHVLHGMWNTPDTDGVVVIGVSVDIEPLLRKLDEIVDSKAKEYVEMCDYIREERGERYYEAAGVNGKYAKFYIVEEQVELSAGIVEKIYREQQGLYVRKDIINMMGEMYDEGDITLKELAFVKNDGKVMNALVERLQKDEDCNVAYNVTLKETIKNVLRKD